MLPLHALVVAIDFSPSADEALVQGAELAERSGAALHIVHADVLFRSSGDGGPPDEAPSPSLRLRAERHVADVLGLPAERLDALDVGGPTVAVVRDVTAPGAILRYVRAVDADLLVLGTHGRSGLSRLLIGSVAEACVAAAPCPVLTVPHAAEPDAPSPIAPVLVAVDFSARSRAALVAGRMLASLYRAPLELVHVVREAGPYPSVAPGVLSIVDADPDLDLQVRNRLVRFAASMPGPPPAALHVALGVPSRVVPALARALGAGALVLGTHGRTGVARALIGSVAEAVLRRSPCPVLTLQAPLPAAVRRPAVRAGLPS